MAPDRLERSFLMAVVDLQRLRRPSAFPTGKAEVTVMATRRRARFAQAREAADRAALAAFEFDPDPDPGKLPGYRAHKPIGMQPETFASIVDRACQLSEETLGHPAERRVVAEWVVRWLRVLP